jgi:hypothetical protein
LVTSRVVEGEGCGSLLALIKAFSRPARETFATRCLVFDVRVGTACRGIAGIYGARVVVVTPVAITSLTIPIDAHVIGRTHVAVIARLFIGRVDASQLGIAAVIGAAVVVVAYQRVSAAARLVLTDRVVRACIVVIAVTFHRGVSTSINRIACVQGTHILVPTRQDVAGNTAPVFARVVGRAHTAIFARKCVGSGNTSRLRVTAIVRARVVVPAKKAPRPDARTIRARILHRTRVVIVTRHLVDRMHATLLRFTGIARAKIGVIAHKRLTSLARTAHTTVYRGADITIVALAVVGIKDAVSAFAGFIRAWVAIVARKRRPARALAVLAGVVDGAGIAVIADPHSILITAPTTRQAAVDGARVAIVTRQRTRPDAGTFDARIGRGAVVLIIAIGLIGRKDAPKIGVASIVRARVSVLAGKFIGTCGASTIGARIT